MSFKRLKNTVKEELVGSKVVSEDIPIQLEAMASPGEFKVHKYSILRLNACLNRPQKVNSRASF